MTQGADYPGYPEPEPEPEEPEESDEALPATGDDSDGDEPTEPEPEPEEAKESDQPAEPENESRSKLEFLGMVISKVSIPLLSATEIVISGTVGALIAVNFSRALEGISPNGFIFLAFLFALFVLPIRFLEGRIETLESGEDDE